MSGRLSPVERSCQATEPPAWTYNGGLRNDARLAALALLLSLPAAVVAQSDDASPVPRLAWGDPNLQGVYLYQTLTPLERPERFAATNVLSPEEAAEYAREQHAAVDTQQLRGDWIPKPFLSEGRTSQIIDPRDGRLPARTPDGELRAKTIGSSPSARPANGPEDRERLERCIMGRSVPLLGRTFEQRVQIYQTPDHVVLQDEFGELRIVPLDGRERLSTTIRQWGGQSLGHWDGDTLVIETTHLNEKWSLFGSSQYMKLTERLSWSTSEALDYSYTVDDPESFARAWTAMFPLMRDPGPIYDYAYHERNESMPLILRGARLEERRKPSAH